MNLDDCPDGYEFSQPEPERKTVDDLATESARDRLFSSCLPQTVKRAALDQYADSWAEADELIEEIIEVHKQECQSC
jgi:hypothetical protein